MDIVCEVDPNVGYYDRVDTLSPNEGSEDEDRRNHGVAMTVETLNFILDDNSRMFEFLRSFGVIAEKYICSSCRKPMTCAKVPTKRCRDGLMWRCRRDKVWRSVRKGTWFEKARITIRAIVLLTYCFCMQKSVSSSCGISGLTDRTVLDWFLSCREICSTLVRRRGKIGGPGVVVELGQSSFGGSDRFCKGKWIAELWVWGAAVCGKEHGELVLIVVEKRDARNLQWLIQEYIEDGTVICSDEWQRYEDDEVDLKSFAVDHNYQLRNNVTGTMERYWTKVKSVVGRGKRRRGGLQSHLDEYIWRESVLGHGCVFHSFIRGVADLYVPCVED